MSNIPEKIEFKTDIAAKLNLSLKITGKRGALHTLDMRVCSVNLFDTVVYIPEKNCGLSVEIECDLKNFDEARFLRSLNDGPEKIRAHFNCAGGKIRIIKRIPLGAGMGGSSAVSAGLYRVFEAAGRSSGSNMRPIRVIVGRGGQIEYENNTTEGCANNNSSNPPTENDLGVSLSDKTSNGEVSREVISLSGSRAGNGFLSQLGSDVPYMYRGGFARVTGVGEITESLPFKSLFFVVAVPDFGVDSGAAYAEYDRIENSADAHTPDAYKNLCGGQYFNDLERAACALEPDVVAARNAMLAAGAENVVMSGSGSAYSAVFDDEEAARKCFDKISYPYSVYLLKSI